MRLFPYNDVGERRGEEFADRSCQGTHAQFFKNRKRIFGCRVVGMETLGSNIAVEEEEEKGVGDGFRRVLKNAGVKSGETAFFIVDLLEGINDGGVSLWLGTRERGRSRGLIGVSESALDLEASDY
jgi:hypothetical protein